MTVVEQSGFYNILFQYDLPILFKHADNLERLCLDCLNQDLAPMCQNCYMPHLCSYIRILCKLYLSYFKEGHTYLGQL